MRASTLQGRNTDMGSSNGLMGLITKVISMRIISTEKEFINGRMEEGLTENGSSTRCTELASSLGLTEENTWENTWTIKKRDREHSNGLMGGNTSENGITGNSMGKERTCQQRETQEKENGRKGREIDGFQREPDTKTKTHQRTNKHLPLFFLFKSKNNTRKLHFD